VADALSPPRDGHPGGGGVDVAPAVEERLARAGEDRIRAARRTLWALEWQPRLTPSGLLASGWRGFSWLPRDARLRLLEGWQRSRWRLRREAIGQLRDLVEEALDAASARQSLPGA
jgi:hypothetical protein